MIEVAICLGSAGEWKTQRTCGMTHQVESSAFWIGVEKKLPVLAVRVLFTRRTVGYGTEDKSHAVEMKNPRRPSKQRVGNASTAYQVLHDEAVGAETASRTRID